MHYSPRDTESILKHYLECFDSKHVDVLNTALEHATEFYHFATDQTAFLMKLFTMRVAKEASLTTLIKIIEYTLKFKY